jgi:hypothetical protein
MRMVVVELNGETRSVIVPLLYIVSMLAYL